VNANRSAEARALPLVELIYAAATKPERWQVFVAELSVELGDPAVMLSLELPDQPESARSFRVHSEDAYARVFAKLFAEGAVPWPMAELAKVPRFVFSEEFLAKEELEKTQLFREYMEPQGLVADGQIGHVMASSNGRPLGSIGVYQRKGGRRIGEQDAAMLDLLVPHLRRAYAIHCELRDSRYRADAIAEAVERFPMGVLFIDRTMRVVDSNRAAKRIAAQQDGFAIVDGVPCATAPSSSAAFARQLERAVKREREPELVLPSDAFQIERPSRLRAYELVVGTLLQAAQASSPRQAVAVVFIADPEDQHLRSPQALASLYDLTNAESELAALLCAGNSIDDAAHERNVTPHTARAQLKKVFAKTGVNRQTELMRLLTGSVAALDEPPEDDGSAD